MSLRIVIGRTCLLLVLAQVVSGQAGEDPYRVVQENIPQQVGIRIYDIIQDHEGFIWLGTDNGLWRFNGTSYRHYTKKAGHGSGLSSNRVFRLFIDREGGLWVGTNWGLNRYRPEEDRFDSYLHDKEDEHSLNHNKVLAISQDKTGNIWVGTYKGMCRIDRETEEIVRYVPSGKHPDEPKEYEVSHFIQDNNKNLWAAVGKGLLFHDAELGSFQLYPFKHKDFGKVTDLSHGPDGGLWVVHDGTFSFFHPKLHSKIPKGKQFAGVEVTRAFQTKKGTVWIGSNYGLYRLMEGTEFNHYGADPTNPNKLSFNEITCLFQSRDDILWVGTKAGLNKVHDKGPHFKGFSGLPANYRRAAAAYVKAITRDGMGNVWVGSSKGLTIREHDHNGKVRWFRFEEDDNQEVNSVTADDRGFVWASTRSALYQIDPRTREIVYRRPHEHESREQVVFASGFIWLGGEGFKGLLRIDPKLYEARHYTGTGSGGDFNPVIYTLNDDGTGRLLLNGPGGIQRYDRETDRFNQVWPLEEKDVEILVSDAYTDEDGQLWLTTMRGLAVLKDGELHYMGSDEGLMDTAHMAILSDEKGYFWLSHEKGITRYNPRFQEGIHYTLDDGLNNKYNYFASHQDADGNIYFGGTNGYTQFHPDTFGKNTHVPPVVIADLQAKNADGMTKIKDPWRHSDLMFEEGSYLTLKLAALDYTNPAKNMYSYKIENFSDSWSMPDNNTFLKLPGLPPGDYTVKVIGSNNDGVWNEHGTSLSFTVIAPWYLSDSALLFYALAIPLLLYLLYRLRVGHLRHRERELASLVDERTAELRLEKEKTEEQARKLKVLDELKTQFFANVSHEFRTPLTLIIGPLETLIAEAGGDPIKRQQRYEVMLRNARRLLRLINQLLDITKLEAGKMSLLARPGLLSEFVKPIVYAFHSLAEKQDMKLFLEVPGEPLEVYFDREKMEKVLFNLLSNAFQHTSAGGEIKVRLEAMRNAAGRKVVQLTVADSGEGIPVEQMPFLFDRFRQVDGTTTRKREGTGIGLSLVKELVTLHGGEVWLESEPGKGTEAHVTLPLGRSHLSREQILEEEIDEQNVRPITQASLELSTLEKTDYAQPTNPAWGETLLVVDDLTDVRAYIRDAFPDYRVVEAVDGEHGLQTARKVKPDLIISDVMMPVMDGYDLCRAVKADRNLRHVPVILLTAKASDEMKVEGLEIGADDYLSKPFNVRELRVRVRNLLAMRGQERRLRRSLEMAHLAQTSMLPSGVPHVPGLDIAAYCQPASEVGGDYYDFVQTADNKLGIVIGDVSGKGMPAALYMTMTKGLVQAYCPKSISPRETLARINRQFNKASTANTFISLLYAIFDPETGTMVYSSAGHNPMLLFRDGRTTVIKSHGMAVGLDRKIFEKVVCDEKFSFRPGDTLVMYTDGITDALNEAEEIFGENRLQDVVSRNGHLTADGVMESLKNAYRSFVGNSRQFDDLTAVVIKIPEAA